MTNFLICAVASIVIFYVIKWFGWFAVDVKGWIPEFIEYKPYKCSFCLSFWTTLIISILLSFINLGFVFGVILDILDAVAYFIDRKENTVNFED